MGGQGASLETAVNGEAAVQRFSESVPGHYTLILMDIQMPTNILKTSLTVSPPGWMFLIIMPGCDSAAAAKRLESGTVNRLSPVLGYNFLNLPFYKSFSVFNP